MRLFKGIGAERRTLEIANPWDLCRAVKAHNDEYAKVYGTARAETTEAVRKPVESSADAGGPADEFDTFGETDRAPDGCMPADPADPISMADPTASAGATL